VVVLIATVGVSLSVAAPALAAGTTRYVATSGSDAGGAVNDCLDPTSPCLTIQHAVDEADAGDTVSVAEGTYSESVVVRTSLTVTGAGATGVHRTTVAGGGSGDPGIRVEGLDAETPPVVTIENLDISNVDASGVEVDGGAAASITHSAIGGNLNGGVIVEAGSASISMSTLDGNVGAGVVSDGTGTSAVITDSTISNTRPFSDSEGTNYGGGVLVFPGGRATITTSTLTGNTGQGVLVDGGTATVSNSTITGTKPTTDSTLVSGAVDNEPMGEATAGSLSLSGTILADNTAPNCSGVVTDSGYNLSDTDVCAFSATGSIDQGVAMLNDPADNGGPTLTQLPAKGSDAIDKIPSGSAGCAPDGADQRGDSRLQGAFCDIGAVEVAQTPLVVTPNALPQGTVGQPYNVTLHGSGGLGGPYTYVLAAGSLPTGLTLSSEGVISGTPSIAGTRAITIAVDDPVDFQFTIVIVAADALANTGAPVPVTGPLAAGGLAVLLGAALLVTAAIRRRATGAVAVPRDRSSR
jgi:hypothetical protein